MTERNANIIRDFMEYIKNYDTEKFIKCMLYCFSAPTIKGIKASCLINFRRRKDENIRNLWISHADEWLKPLGLEWILFDQQNKHDSALVLIYRRKLLIKALGCDEACKILKSHGYPLHDVDACLECLRGKFCSGFPHEIGLFLDYPPEDVKGFIEGKCAKNSGCPGYWKVYGDVRKAKRKFKKYKRAECDAAQRILTGGL